MTTAKKMELIGKPAKFRTVNRDGVQVLLFPVTIKDVRERFGRVDYLIEPIGGAGERWVGSDAVEVLAQ